MVFAPPTALALPCDPPVSVLRRPTPQRRAVPALRNPIRRRRRPVEGAIRGGREEERRRTSPSAVGADGGGRSRRDLGRPRRGRPPPGRTGHGYALPRLVPVGLLQEAIADRRNVRRFDGEFHRNE